MLTELFCLQELVNTGVTDYIAIGAMPGEIEESGCLWFKGFCWRLKGFWEAIDYVMVTTAVEW